MPRRCTVCQHPERAAIDRALVRGEPTRGLAARYGSVSREALWRHKEDHLPQALAKAQEASEVARADDLLRELMSLRAKAISLLLKAEQSGDYRTALQGIREARGCIETLLEVEGRLNRQPQLNVLATSSWWEVRTTILEALRAHAEARVAVAAALAALEAGRVGD